MQQATLRATVQYQDYQGTVAADHADRRFLSALAGKHGIDTDRYFIIGVRINIGEIRDENDELGAHTYIDLLAVDMVKTKAGDIDHIRKYAESNGGKLPYKSFSIKCSLDEALHYFKRFEVVLFSKVLEGVRTFDDASYE